MHSRGYPWGYPCVSSTRIRDACVSVRVYVIQASERKLGVIIAIIRIPLLPVLLFHGAMQVQGVTATRLELPSTGERESPSRSTPGRTAAKYL